MKKLFDTKPVLFAVLCIIVYVIGFGTLGSLSDTSLVNYGAVLGFSVVYSGFLLFFAKKHGLLEYWFLQGSQTPAKRLLYWLPLFAVMTVNLWGGIRLREDALSTVVGILARGLGAGFLEELIFRGILLRAVARKNTLAAFLWSALGFGIGHIVNLLYGQDTVQTLIQLVYASCIGFAFMAVVWTGRSILPTVFAHALNNSLSFFANMDAVGTVWDYVSTGILCAVCVGYGFFVLYTADKKLTTAPLEA